MASRKNGAAPAAADADEAAPAPVPDVIEGPGRYRVFAGPEGSWVIARAGPLCDRCAGCGCGEQGEPITIPGLVIQVARQRMNGDGGPGLMAMLKAVTGRG